MTNKLVSGVDYFDYPVEEIINALSKIDPKKNVQVFQKFTCELCEKRLTIDEPEAPNTFYGQGICECGHRTNLNGRFGLATIAKERFAKKDMINVIIDEYSSLDLLKRYY